MKIFHIFIICVLPICVSEAARILGLINYTGRSHYVMFHTFFRALAARGHHVEVYGHHPLEKPMPNYTDFSISGPAVLNDMSIEQMSGMGYYQVLSYFKNNFLETCRSVIKSQNIMNLMNSNTTYDVIITHLLGSDCLIGFVHRFQAPLVSITTSTSLPWVGIRNGNPDNPAYIPSYYLPFTDQMNFWERLVNAVFYLATNLWYCIEIDMPTEEMLEQHFGKNCPSVHELQWNTSLILVNSHFSVNTPRPAVPTFVEVGGLHINNRGKLPEDLQTYLDEAKEGVIYFSMGSMIRSETFTETKLRAFIDAFSQLPQRVLWKTGNISELPTNVKTAAWLPQLEILSSYGLARSMWTSVPRKKSILSRLRTSHNIRDIAPEHPHVRVFITHGGLLGTQEAIYAGVPMIGMPMMNDQQLNVKNYVSKGVAVQLNYDSITTENVLKALVKVLHDPSYRTNAKRLSQLFRDRPQSALDTAIYWTEYVIRHRGAPHLRSAALDLTWYQYLLLDVILVIIALIIALGLIVFYSFKIMLKLVTGNVSQAAVTNHSPVTSISRRVKHSMH